MKKLLFIMNPFAGQKKANKVLPEILMVFTEAGYEINISMTTGPGSAMSLAAERGGKADLVVCCGGDGTLNETISGLLMAGIQVPVGYIPSGTTNDFASSLKLSHNPVQAAKDILEGQPVAYDIGKFGDRYFCYVASFGAFTKSSYAVPYNITKTPFWKSWSPKLELEKGAIPLSNSNSALELHILVGTALRAVRGRLGTGVPTK